MNGFEIGVGFVAAGLLVYLVIALINAEDFS